MALLEFGQAEVQLHARELGIELQSLAVGGGGLGIFLLPARSTPRLAKARGVGRIAIGDGYPSLGGFGTCPAVRV